MSDDKLFVQYLGNAETYNNTEAINFDDEREPLVIGGTGYMTEAEIANAHRFGLRVVQTNENAVKPVSELKADEVKEQLDILGVPYAKGAKADDLAVLLEQQRAGVEGQASSPAVASGAGDSTASAAATGSATAGTAGNGGTAASTGATS